MEKIHFAFEVKQKTIKNGKTKWKNKSSTHEQEWKNDFTFFIWEDQMNILEIMSEEFGMIKT
jgi:hypothetical protein